MRPPRVVAVKTQPRLLLVGLAVAHHPHKFVAPALKSCAVLGAAGGKVDSLVPCGAFQDVSVQAFACVNYHRLDLPLSIGPGGDASGDVEGKPVATSREELTASLAGP